MPVPGTRIHVEPGQWQPSPGRAGHTAHTLDIVSAHQSHDPAWAWVYGHGVDCSWESADCRQPWCWEILVLVEVLDAAAAASAEPPATPLMTRGQMARSCSPQPTR